MSTVKKTLIFSLICLLFLSFTGSAGFSQSEKEPEIVVEKSVILQAPEVEKIVTETSKTNKPYSLLKSDLTKQGFTPVKTTPAYLGRIDQFKVKDKSYKHEVYVQDFVKKGSKDTAGLCRIVISSGNDREEYSFYLVAKDGDLKNILEFRVNPQGQIIKANSWWSCTKDRVKEKCASACLTAFITCIPFNAGSLAGYIACVISSCAQCVIKASACCACNCKGWCKWAVSCCHR